MSAKVVDLELWRDVRLTERALDGDVDAAIACLHKYGALAWRDALHRVNV